jgi:hypothetical protein
MAQHAQGWHTPGSVAAAGHYIGSRVVTAGVIVTSGDYLASDFDISYVRLAVSYTVVQQRSGHRATPPRKVDTARTCSTRSYRSSLCSRTACSPCLSSLGRRLHRSSAEPVLTVVRALVRGLTASQIAP